MKRRLRHAPYALALVIFAWLACGRGASAAATDDPWSGFVVPTFHTFDQEDGLPHDATTAIAQDGSGFLWFGTQGGLARFDGYRFRNYQPSSTDANALRDGSITTLHADRAGVLWIGTNAGGLARYDARNDRFVSYRAGRGELSSSHVTAIADDGANGLFVGTERGLDHLDVASGRVVVARGTANDRVLSLLRDRTGSLWIGTSEGLFEIAHGTSRVAPVAFPGRAPGAVACIYQDGPGRLWFGTNARGAFVLGPHDAKPFPVRDRTGKNVDLPTERVSTITTGARGDIWLGTFGHGIVVVDRTDGAIGHIAHAAATGSLPEGNVWASFRDRVGDVWLGTLAGVSRLTSSDDAIYSLRAGGDPRTSLSEDDVVSIGRIRDGRVWAGSLAKGIDIIDVARHRIANVPPSARPTDATLPRASVLAIADAPDGNVYVGTIAGLYRIDRAATRIERMRLPGREPTALAHAIVLAGKRVWVVDADDGVWSFSPGTDGRDARHFDASALSDRRIVSLLPGRAHELWIGTGDGLNRLDLATHAIERVLPAPRDPTRLGAGYVASMAFDATGRLWVATTGGGIGVVVGRTAGRLVLRRVTKATGLPDDAVDALQPDRYGRMWASTDRGLAVIDEATFAVRALGRPDGAPTTPYFENSAAALPNGDLLFGNFGAGLTVVRPDRFRVRTASPPIVVTEARVGGHVVASSRFNEAGTSLPLVVPPDANSLLIEFSALDYSSPTSNRYAYRLDGFDRTWVYTDASRRLAAYTNLPPGDHVLELRGSDRNGTWSVATARVLVRVVPAWYQTWWFRTLGALAAALCVIVVVQGRTAYLCRRQIELERLVAERTAELEESKRQIEAIALSDPLTGLPNRRQFNYDVRALTAGARRNRRHVALLLIDLDHFKAVNDTLGHDAGDALLVEVARRLRLALRLSDRIARLGGDEFAILLDDLPGAFATDRDGVASVCARVLEAFETPVALDGDVVRTTPSIGVALAPEHAEKPEALYKAADVALYRSKREGRNTWRVHEPSDDPAKPGAAHVPA